MVVVEAVGRVVALMVVVVGIIRFMVGIDTSALPASHRSQSTVFSALNRNKARGKRRDGKMAVQAKQQHNVVLLLGTPLLTADIIKKKKRNLKKRVARHRYFGTKPRKV